MQTKMHLSQYIKKFERELELVDIYWISNMMEIGKGNFFIIRQKKSGKKVMCCYLVDTYFLVVKERNYEEYEYYEFVEFIGRHFGGMGVNYMYINFEIRY